MSTKKTLHLYSLHLFIKSSSNTFAVPAMGGEFIALLYPWLFLNPIHLTVRILHELDWNNY